jgi:hypothetical protein
MKRALFLIICRQNEENGKDPARNTVTAFEKASCLRESDERFDYNMERIMPDVTLEVDEVGLLFFSLLCRYL